MRDSLALRPLAGTGRRSRISRSPVAFEAHPPGLPVSQEAFVPHFRNAVKSWQTTA